MMNPTPRAPTPAEAVKLLRDALTDILKRSMESNIAHIAKDALALTADASEDAPDGRHKLIPMQNDEGKRGWYFDSDEFYIDIDLEDDGTHTVYFRNRKDGSHQLYAPYLYPAARPALDTVARNTQKSGQKDSETRMDAHSHGGAQSARPAPVGAGMAVGREKFDAAVLRQDEKEALDDLRKAIKAEAADAWVLNFVRQYPFKWDAYFVAPAAPVTDDTGILAHQVAQWRKEVARLQGLIATAGGAPVADAGRSKCKDDGGECGTGGYCLECPLMAWPSGEIKERSPVDRRDPPFNPIEERRSGFDRRARVAPPKD